MHLSSILLGALAIPILASAEAVAEPQLEGARFISKVVNNCPFTAYVQSFPHDGSAPSSVEPLTGHGMGYFDVGQGHSGGSTFSIGRTRKLARPLTFHFTPHNGLVHYELSSYPGNPFIDYTNKLVPDDRDCPKVRCLPEDGGCYSGPTRHQVETCQQTSLTLTLCA